MPLISKRYDIRLPIGRPCNKKIMYTNPYSTDKVFRLRTDQVLLQHYCNTTTSRLPHLRRTTIALLRHSTSANVTLPPLELARTLLPHSHTFLSALRSRILFATCAVCLVPCSLCLLLSYLVMCPCAVLPAEPPAERPLPELPSCRMKNVFSML